jgi:dTMP kinase
VSTSTRGGHIQQVPQQRPDLTVLPAPSDEQVTYATLLKNRNFRRLFFAQMVSSLGDWIGVLAIVVMAQRIGGPTGVGVVMIARVLPGFFVGPLAGVIADRWDRKRTMVVADISRAVIIFSLPLFPNLVYLLLASAALESLTLVWGPAKDASLPHLVPMHHLTHANSLSLLGVYGPWPIATVVYAVLVTVSAAVADSVPVLSGLADNPAALALWLDSGTFVFSAMMITTLSIPSSRHRGGTFQLGDVWRDLVEGLRFVVRHRKVRPWIIGIALTFTAAGGVFSLGVGFADVVLGAGDRGFVFLIGFLATGMIIGLLAVGQIAKRMQKDVLFSSSILLLGAGLIALAAMNSLDAAIPIASALGFFGGAAYSTGYSLMHENTEDELRGRTFSAAYTAIRIGTLLGLGLFPLVAGAVGDYILRVGTFEYFLPGSRSTLMLAGLIAIGGGLLSMRAIKERWDGGGSGGARSGYFVVFEGGEGAGKSTQISAFVSWLEARGDSVVATREPGGTAIGTKIRAVLLDPASADMDARAEALLYAADRAQHVAEVIRPALSRGKIVVSDRFIDSSLAYQGLGRDLGIEKIFEISEWAIAGLLPDLVFYLQVEAEVGMGRLDRMHDRIEQEEPGFHERVADAYVQIAERYPERFAVVDASGPPSEVHKEIVKVFQERSRHARAQLSIGHDVPPPGPMPR